MTHEVERVPVKGPPRQPFRERTQPADPRLSGTVMQLQSRLTAPVSGNVKSPISESVGFNDTQCSVCSGRPLPRLQAKLTIGKVNDPLEQEADAAADRVMRMADPEISHAAPPTLSRNCVHCEEEVKRTNSLQRRASGGHVVAEGAPPIVDAVLASPGRPLDPATHDFMASRFGKDFSDVRIHTDARASESAGAVGAQAYTVGRNIVFGTGRYDPTAPAGRHLLAHELAHVVQQGSAPSAKSVIWRAPARRLKNHKQAVALGAADARQLIESQLPTVAPLLTPGQYEQLQGVLDAAVVNPVASENYEKAYREAIDYYNPETGFIHFDDKKKKRAWRQFEAESIPDDPSKHRLRIDYRWLLTPEALRELTDNPDEAEYLKRVRSTLETKGVWLQITPSVERLPDDPNRIRQSRRKFTAWLSLGHQNLGKSNAITLQNGRLNRDALLDIQSIGAGYYEAVHTGRVLSTLDRALSRLRIDIEAGSEQHYELASIRRKTTFGVVEASDFLGGADFPDPSIWDQPHALLLKALEYRAARTNMQISGTRAMLAAAGIVTRNCAMLISQYIEDTTDGAAMAVKVLEVAEKAGEVAQIALTVADGVAVVKGAVSLVRGYREASAAGKTFVIVIGRGSGVDAAANKFISHFAAEHPNAAAELSRVPLRPPELPKLSPTRGRSVAGGAAEQVGSGSAAGRVVPKETAAARAEVKVIGSAERHEVVVKGSEIGRCSPPPCPNISLVYKEDLARNKGFAARFKTIRKLAEHNPERAAASAAALVEDIEMARRLGSIGNAELVAETRAAIARLRALRAAKAEIKAADLNAAERALKALRERHVRDPKLAKAVEESTEEFIQAIHENQRLVGTGPTSNAPRTSAADNARLAEQEGLVDLEKGRAGVQTHSTASETRKALGTSGATHQSAHLVPQAVDRALRVSTGQAVTVNLPIATHRAIDGHWVPIWKRAVANGERITAGQVMQWVGEGIQGVDPSKLSRAAKNTLEWRLFEEFRELGLTADSVIIPGKP